MAARVVPMDVRETAIAGLWQVAAKSITDERGTVREFFRSTGFSELGVTVSSRWTQINLTWTARGAIRGLHGEAITKLVGVASGAAHGVYLDARKGSPTYGKVVTVPLEVGLEMLVPPGVCNGFQALSEGGCQYLYCFDAEWTPGMAGTSVNPLDPALGIDWPLPVDAADPAAISHKDATAPLFAELA